MNVISIVLVILGIFFIILAAKATKRISRFSPESRFNTPLLRNLFFFLPISAIGVMCFISAFVVSKGVPMHRNLKSDKGRLLLLERGVIAQGTVRKVFFREWAPMGWKVVYEFDVSDPKTGQPKNYTGSSQGPKKYYSHLSEGQVVTVIYDPCNPNLNCEIRRFLNKPSFRRTFKRKGKIHLLDKFKDEYEIESYAYKEWYELQWEK